MSFKILNTIGDVFAQEAKSVLGQCGTADYHVPTQEGLQKSVADYDALLVGLGLNIDKDIIDRGTKLKVITTATTGLDHIDVDYAKKKGIEILSLRGENEFLDTITGTAELAFGLLLSLARFIPHSFDDVKEYRWQRDNFRGNSIYGKTLGVVGMGRLGKIIAKGAEGFRMNVLFHDPRVEQEAFPQYKKVSFNELLKQSDFVSVHVHLAPETEKLINKDAFSKMKESAFIINTSRGEIVDEEALLKALKNGEIAGYGTDVLAGELAFADNFSNYPLIEYAKKNRNIIIVPHTGGMTHDSRIATDVFIAEKLKKYITQAHNSTK